MNSCYESYSFLKFKPIPQHLNFTADYILYNCVCDEHKSWFLNRKAAKIIDFPLRYTK